MEIKVGDKFEEKDEGVIWLIDKIIGNQIYHHTIGIISTIPNSEIKNIEILLKYISDGILQKV